MGTPMGLVLAFSPATLHRAEGFQKPLILYRGACRPSAVDPRHDPLCDCDGIRNGGLQRRRGSSVPVRELSRSKNARRDEQHALATLVHKRIVSNSPFVRLSR